MFRILSAILLLSCLGSAQAYELHAKSENPQLGDQALAELVHKIGEEVGNNIPASKQVRVYAISQAKPRAGKADSGEILYNHRVELRKLFDGRSTPPYPVAGWFVIYTSETYGIGNADKSRAELEDTIRKFFEHLKGLDPKTQAP